MSRTPAPAPLATGDDVRAGEQHAPWSEAKMARFDPSIRRSPPVPATVPAGIAHKALAPSSEKRKPAMCADGMLVSWSTDSGSTCCTRRDIAQPPSHSPIRSPGGCSGKVRTLPLSVQACRYVDMQAPVVGAVWCVDTARTFQIRIDGGRGETSVLVLTRHESSPLAFSWQPNGAAYTSMQQRRETRLDKRECVETAQSPPTHGRHDAQLSFVRVSQHPPSPPAERRRLPVVLSAGAFVVDVIRHVDRPRGRTRGLHTRSTYVSRSLLSYVEYASRVSVSS